MTLRPKCSHSAHPQQSYAMTENSEKTSDIKVVWEWFENRLLMISWITLVVLWCHLPLDIYMHIFDLCDLDKSSHQGQKIRIIRKITSLSAGVCSHYDVWRRGQRNICCIFEATFEELYIVTLHWTLFRSTEEIWSLQWLVNIDKSPWINMRSWRGQIMM